MSGAVAAGGAGAASAVDPNIPGDRVLYNAAKLAIEHDKPILLDYYKETRAGTAFLGEDKETKERILVKGAEDYTSPIQKLFKVKDDFIVMTENSIYVVSGQIQKKEIKSSAM
jgi:hypothetical protein